MASDPAERFAVESTQVGELDATDGQHWLPVTTPDFEAPVLTLKRQKQPHFFIAQKDAPQPEKILLC